jgi:hypothetical protein
MDLLTSNCLLIIPKRGAYPAKEKRVNRFPSGGDGDEWIHPGMGLVFDESGTGINRLDVFHKYTLLLSGGRTIHRQRIGKRFGCSMDVPDPGRGTESLDDTKLRG